jgi:hypothetical protein
MLEKIKSMFRREKKPAEHSKESQQTLWPVIGVVFGIFVGFVSYRRTDSLLPLIFAPFVFLVLALLLSPDAFQKKDTKLVKEKKQTYLNFYRNFLIYACLENSYRDGLRATVGQMEISDLKDSLSQYLEKEDFNLPLPLAFTNSRLENNLVDALTKLIRSEEDYDRQDLESLSYALTGFQEELFPPVKVILPSLPALPVALGYLVCLLYAFLVIKNG